MVCLVVLIVNRSQQIRTEGFAPRSVYSRWINLYLYIAAGLGNDDFQTTPPLGKDLWLLEMQVTFMPYSVVRLGQCFLYINAGSAEVPAVNDVLNQWDPVIQTYGAAKNQFQFYGLQQQFVFTQQKRFMGTARRFGAIVENLSNTTALRLWISFLVSEG